MSEEDTGQALGGDGADDTPADDGPQLTEVEQLAAERGWKPKSDFKGNEADWRPASEFIRRIPDQRSIQREMKHLRDTMDKMTSAQSKTMARALDEQRQGIEARYNDAFDKGDKAGAAKAVREMDALVEEANTTPEPSMSEKEFAERNTWYGQDEEATNAAIAECNRLARLKKPIDEQLAGVEKYMKRRFPELYGEAERPAARQQPAVHTPSRGSGNRGPKGYADLPVEAKRAADRFASDVASKYGKDPEAFKKQYATDYWNNVEAA